jgi:hypothetical protein
MARTLPEAQQLEAVTLLEKLAEFKTLDPYGVHSGSSHNLYHIRELARRADELLKKQS